MSIEAVRQSRRMPWLKTGMIVEVAGRRGKIVGGNSHCNLNVRYDGESRRRKHNCHPTWQTIYYDDQGNIIADYTQGEDKA